MAAGEIKNVLTLDVSKFTTAIDRATGNLESLDKLLKEAGKGAVTFEKNVTALGSDVAGAAEKFKLLDQTLANLTSKLDKVGADGFGGLSTKARRAKKDVADFSEEASKSGKSLQSMTQWVKDYGVAMESLKPSLNQAVRSQGELTKAHKETADGAKQSAAAQIKAKIEALNIERETNAKIIADKRKLAAELKQLESEIRADAGRKKFDADTRYFGRNANSNNANLAHGDVSRLLGNADSIGVGARGSLQEAAALDAVNERLARRIARYTALDAGMKAHNEVVAAGMQAEMRSEVADKNREKALAGINKLIGQAAQDTNSLATATIKSGDAMLMEAMATTKAEGAIRAKARAQAEANLGKNALLGTIQKVREESGHVGIESMYGENHLGGAMASIMAEGKAKLDGEKTVEAERVKNDRERQKSDKEHFNQMAQMWKSMAQMWAGAKIGQGLGASVDAADKFQREQMVASGLNLSKGETDYINQKAWDDSKALKFASALDMIKARMAAIGGLGENNVKVIDSLLGDASKVAHNIQAITGDKSQAGFENMIRNLFGVIEARQQTNDPAAAKKTLDMVQKIYIGTGRKIDIADIETFLRRDATGADKISDEGLARVVAFLDQAKVSGGHGGGQSGAGVSTVGTMVKMFQKMANGGLMTERGSKEFAEAGLMDLSVMDGKSGKAAMKALREGGLNVASLSNSDPVAALQKISTAALSFMTREENLKKYFPGGDAKDPAAIKDAFTKFAIGTGWSTNAVAMLTTAGNAAAMHRADASAQTIMNSKGGDAMNEEVMKSYAGNVDAFKASMENLKISLGTSVLPLLTKFAETIAAIVAKIAEFSKNNPLATQFAVIGAAIGGAVISFKGFMGLFGTVGSLTSVLRGLAGAATSSGSAVESVTKAGTGLERMFGAGGLSTAKWNINIGETISKLTGLGATAGGTASRVTSGFSAMASGMMGAGAKMITIAGRIGAGMLQMVPIIGQLATLFLLTDWLANLEVGGAAIGTWVMSFGDAFVTGIETFMLRARAVFSSDSEKLLKQAEDLENALHRRQIANGTRDEAKSVTAHESPAEMEARQEREYQADQKRLAREKELAAERAKAAAATKKLQDEAKARLAGLDDPSGAGGKHNRGFEDLFNKSFQDIAAHAEELKLKINSLMTGEGSYSDQANAMVMGKLLGGNFDKAHDPKNRAFINKKDSYSFDAGSGTYKRGGKTVDPTEAIDTTGKYLNGELLAEPGQKGYKKEDYDQGKSLDDMKLRAAETLRLTDAEKALVFAKERAAAAGADANAAAVRAASDGYPKQTAAMKALVDEFARLDARSAAGGGNDKFAAQIKSAKDEALALRALADLQSHITDNNEADKRAAAASLMDGSGNFIEDRDRVASQWVEKIRVEEAGYQRLLTAAKDNHSKIGKLEDDHLAHVKELERQKAEAMMTPLQKLMGEWKKVKTQIESDEAKWANGFLGVVEKTLDTGQGDINQFLRDILIDIRRTLLKDLLASPVQALMSTVGSAAKGIFTAGNGGGDGAGGMGSMFGKMGGALKDFWGSLTGASGATGELAKAAGEGAAKTASEVIGISTKMTAEQTASMAMTSLAVAADGAASALASIAATGGGGGAGGLVGSMMGMMGGGDGAVNLGTATGADMMAAFADGGVMTNLGPVALRKYAAGGIANSPQLALYGEAGPEAYVPLPDGRSIPVTVKSTGGAGGGGDQNVSISITVNQDGSGGKSATGDDKGAWMKIADRVKSVVQGELVNQQRPGGILYK